MEFFNASAYRPGDSYPVKIDNPIHDQIMPRVAAVAAASKEHRKGPKRIWWWNRLWKRLIKRVYQDESRLFHTLKKRRVERYDETLAILFEAKRNV